MLARQLMHDLRLDGILRRRPILLALLADGVGQPLIFLQGDTYLLAFRRRDPPLPLQLAPRHIKALWADQAEDVRLAPILAHKRRRQSEPPPRLNLGGDAEDRRG